MKKNWLIIVVIIILLLGLGGFFILSSNKTPTASKATDNSRMGQSVTKPATNSVISSIKDALMGSQSLSCNFTDERGIQTTSYIKNGMIRADIVASDPKQSGSFLMRDKKMYFWNAQKQGFMSEFTPNYDEIAQDMSASKSAPQQNEEMIKSLEKYKESCKPVAVDENKFAVPTDITFTDMSKMMKAPPVRTGVEPSIDQKQIENMMKQYTPNTTPPAENQGY